MKNKNKYLVLVIALTFQTSLGFAQKKKVDLSLLEEVASETAYIRFEDINAETTLVADGVEVRKHHSVNGVEVHVGGSYPRYRAKAECFNVRLFKSSTEFSYTYSSPVEARRIINEIIKCGKDENLKITSVQKIKNEYLEGTENVEHIKCVSSAYDSLSAVLKDQDLLDKLSALGINLKRARIVFNTYDPRLTDIQDAEVVDQDLEYGAELFGEAGSTLDFNVAYNSKGECLFIPAEELVQTVMKQATSVSSEYKDIKNELKLLEQKMRK